MNRLGKSYESIISLSLYFAELAEPTKVICQFAMGILEYYFLKFQNITNHGVFPCWYKLSNLNHISEM